MRFVLAPNRAAALLLLCAALACSGTDPASPDGGPVEMGSSDGGREAGGDRGPPPDLTGDHGAPPPDALAPFCAGKTWQSTVSPTTVGKLKGSYAGYIPSLSGNPLPAWTMEFIKVIPEHPVRLRSIRVALARGSGTWWWPPSPPPTSRASTRTTARAASPT